MGIKGFWRSRVVGGTKVVGSKGWWESKGMGV